MGTISLTDIQEAADKKYGPLVIEGVPGGDVSLTNPIRLGEKKFAVLREILKREIADDDLAGVKAKVTDLVTLTAPSKTDAARLLKALGDDLGALAVILSEYGKQTQAGEASPSPS